MGQRGRVLTRGLYSRMRLRSVKNYIRVSLGNDTRRDCMYGLLLETVASTRRWSGPFRTDLTNLETSLLL